MIKQYFQRVDEEIEKTPELKLLLEQTIIDENPRTIYEAIKINLYHHESMNPDMWNDPALFYGHVGILISDFNSKLVSRTFVVPILDIKITVGCERAINEKRGARVVWEKQKT